MSALSTKQREKYVDMIRSYMKKNIHVILKPANNYLAHPFVDPGSVYDGNLWDWDSFWAVYGLLNMVQDGDEENRSKILAHAKGNIYNFFDHQLEDGYIPMMIEKTNLPEPYLNLKHKQNMILNMCKPFLCQQIALISGYEEDFSWIAPYVEEILLYFSCYDRYYYHINSGLYVWADDVMIGVDNDPATFGRPRFSTANIYLNSFMISELRAAAKIFRALDRAEDEKKMNRKADGLIDSIQAECWDKRDKIFYSVDVDIQTRAFDWFHQGLGVFWKTLPIKIRSWSSLIPLYAGIPNSEQAEYLRNHCLDKNTFYSSGGITSLAMDEKMFNLEPTNNPSNWLGPIWIVAQYIVFRGLMNYGYTKEALELCDKIILLIGRDIEKTGTLHEFYHPMSGEPIMNGGFLNWNILVLNMIDESTGKKPMYDLIFS